MSIIRLIHIKIDAGARTSSNQTRESKAARLTPGGFKRNSQPRMFSYGVYRRSATSGKLVAGKKCQSSRAQAFRQLARAQPLPV
jgi:hypothetical protein